MMDFKETATKLKTEFPELWENVDKLSNEAKTVLALRTIVKEEIAKRKRWWQFWL